MSSHFWNGLPELLSLTSKCPFLCPVPQNKECASIQHLTRSKALSGVSSTFAEDDDTLSPEERALQRLQKQRTRQLSGMSHLVWFPISNECSHGTCMGSACSVFHHHCVMLDLMSSVLVFVKVVRVSGLPQSWPETAVTLCQPSHCIKHRCSHVKRPIGQLAELAGSKQPRLWLARSSLLRHKPKPAIIV